MQRKWTASFGTVATRDSCIDRPRTTYRKPSGCGNLITPGSPRIFQRDRTVCSLPRVSSIECITANTGARRRVRDHRVRAERKAAAGVPAAPEETRAMKRTRFPTGWDEARVRKVIEHYERQTEEEAVAEDEAGYEDPKETVMMIPTELVPAVRELLARHGH